jgi:hypothetical protein
VTKPQKHDFSLKLTRVIEPKGGTGVELATLEDAARFMGEHAALATGTLGVCGGAGAHRRRHGRRGGHRESDSTISLTLMTSVAAHPEPIGTRTCARWLDGREQHLSTTMETWVEGYLASSNQWALALGVNGGAAACPKVVEID